MRRMHAASRLAGVQRRLRGQVPQARGGVAAAAGQVAPVRAEAHRQHRVCVACGCARLDRLVPCHWPGCANGLQRRAGASAAAAWRGRYGWRMDSGCRGSCASRCRHARPSTPRGTAGCGQDYVLRQSPAPASDAVQRDTGRTRNTACGWYTMRSAASTDSCAQALKMILTCRL
jgi:hypothetical protein